MEERGGASFFGGQASFFGARGAPLEGMQQPGSGYAAAHAEPAQAPTYAYQELYQRQLGGMDGETGVSQSHGMHAHARQHGDAAVMHGGMSTTADQLEALRAQQAQYQAWFAEYLGNAGGGSGGMGHMGEGADVQGLLAALYSASSGSSYLHYLKQAAEALRGLERTLREVEGQAGDQEQALASMRAPHGGMAHGAPDPGAAGSLDQYLATLGSATDALACTSTALESAAYYAPGVAQLPSLAQASAGIDARLQSARYALYQRLLADVGDVLDLCCWPPPLIKGAPDAGANGGAARFSSWGAALPRLNGLLAQLNRLQIACEKAAFAQLLDGSSSAAAASSGSPAAEAPLLWSMAQLTGKLTGRLQAHFSPGSEAGRLDRPEWLLKTVIVFLEEHAGAAEALQPSLHASGLSGVCHACVEFSRAARESVRVVLHSSRLPALLGAGHEYEALWPMQVDAILDFEKQLAPFLGALHVSPDAEVPEALSAGSCLAAVTSEPDFMHAWAGAERSAAAGGLALVPSSSSAVSLWGAAGAEAGSRGREFFAPEFAEAAADAIGVLVERSRHAPAAPQQRAFLEAATSPLLDSLDETVNILLSAAGAQAAAAGSRGSGLAGAAQAAAQRAKAAVGARQANTTAADEAEADAALIATCAGVCASRYLHHALSDALCGPSLFRVHREQLARVSGPGAATDPHALATQVLMQSPGPKGRAMPHAMHAPSTASFQPPPLTGASALGDDLALLQQAYGEATDADAWVLVQRTVSLGARHREACLSLAQQLSVAFARAAEPYRALVSRAPSYPHMAQSNGDHPSNGHNNGDHHAPSAPSPELLPALAGLERQLRLLCGHLDGPSFRDVWRATAVPLNRFMFNHVVTEARFTPPGAAQLGVDAASLAALFAPYTRKPAAHVRETLGAARLLGLTDNEAAEVVRRVSTAMSTGGPDAHKKDSLLLQLGAACLTPNQIVAVIERRL
ncbi:hypothetical protein FOA52_011105 [Chlamydomonas sp. UWO 241]|nr:hypothetical protein FOA52_011105 [Chlamydomonas sp. UWO 241]